MNSFLHTEALEMAGFFNAGLNTLPITPYTITEGHELVEILTGGTVFFETEEGRETFQRGTVFWHIAGDKTIWDTPEEAPYKCAVFRFAVTKRCRTMPRVSRWRGSDASFEEFLQFSRNWFDTSPGDPQLFSYTLATLAAHASAPENIGSRRQIHGEQFSALHPLAKIIRHLEKTPGSPPDINELCALSGLNRNRLFKEFSAAFGMTPHSYITFKRIELARSLLENTTGPIKEISGACGFANIEVFYRTFRKYTGVTPKEYRNSCASYNL